MANKTIKLLLIGGMLACLLSGCITPLDTSTIDEKLEKKLENSTIGEQQLNGKKNS